MASCTYEVKDASWHDLCNKGVYKIPTCPIIFGTTLCMWWKPLCRRRNHEGWQNKTRSKGKHVTVRKAKSEKKENALLFFVTTMNVWVTLIGQSLSPLPFTLVTQQCQSSAFAVDELMVFCGHTSTRQCTVTCQIIRSWATMLVMSASLCPTCIYDLLAARVVLSCAHEVKVIKVTSPRETTQHLSSSFTPSAAGVSSDLPARRCTRFPLIRNSLILLSEHGR